jgi:hypothetical protein
MPTPTCDRCRLLETEVWCLSQRLADLDRRLTDLAQALERLARVEQALRWDATPAPAPAPGRPVRSARRQRH